jgi:hypothetical protein
LRRLRWCVPVRSFDEDAVDEDRSSAARATRCGALTAPRPGTRPAIAEPTFAARHGGACGIEGPAKDQPIPPTTPNRCPLHAGSHSGRRPVITRRPDSPRWKSGQGPACTDRHGACSKPGRHRGGPGKWSRRRDRTYRAAGIARKAPVADCLGQAPQFVREKREFQSSPHSGVRGEIAMPDRGPAGQLTSVAAAAHGAGKDGRAGVTSP